MENIMTENTFMEYYSVLQTEYNLDILSAAFLGFVLYLRQTPIVYKDPAVW